jgi:hypothetical protein
MTTKQAFLAQADIELLNPQYGKIAELKQAQDPFVVAQIGAMAQMLDSRWETSMGIIVLILTQIILVE